jgi:uncharacterized membrane protein YoaK (UPF0700 family)
MPPAETSNQTNPLTNALLLAATGGLLDAVVFLNHGHVFANAMSGNVVFLGIAAVSRDWGQIIPHLVPIGGFLVGVTTSKQVRYRLSEHSVLLLGLAAESLALFALGWLPADFPDMAFTAIIAFVSAFQAASYRHVGSFSYNSTFVTGNLRDTVEGICDAISFTADPEAREQGLAKALDLGSICLCFLAGAILGASAAPRFYNRSLWLAEPFLLAVLLQAFRPWRQLPPSPLKS